MRGKEQLLEQEDDAKPDEHGRMGGCAKDRFSRQNPPTDCRADRVFSSFAGCGGSCPQGFLRGQGPTTLIRFQKCAKDIEQRPNFAADQGSVSEFCRMDHVEIRIPKVSSQESVEAVKHCLSGTHLKTGCVNRTRFLKCPKILSVEAVKN